MSKKITTVLIIDDDLAINYLHQRMISKAEISDSIITAINGQIGIDEIIKLNQQLHKDSFVLILLDINMPILDGWGFLEKLEDFKEELNFNMELYILSSSFNPDDILKAETNPFVKEYLSKPLTLEMIEKFKIIYQ